MPKYIPTIDDMLYWKLRHTALFLINLPFMPINALYWVLREIIDNIPLCFTCDGSTQISPFWRWQWRRPEE